jgi:hypothetical protein
MDAPLVLWISRSGMGNGGVVLWSGGGASGGGAEGKLWSVVLSGATSLRVSLAAAAGMSKAAELTELL